ncbi:MAG: sterol desaturase family protein [Spirochaetales bacterium]|nr:sterol desaturase family protein [Spirochaetales bacterium]
MIIVRSYLFWLLVTSFIVLLAERIRPWRKKQGLLRKEIGQDLLWFVFNGFIGGIIFAVAFNTIYSFLRLLFSIVFLRNPETILLLNNLPFPLQILLYLIITDFLEWCIHNLLHRVPFLWKFHRVHHSITTMDWIGNFRFHWLELFVYNTLKFLPIAVLGAHPDAILIVAVITTLIGHLNHSNLNISWGFFRYLLNSPRMHIWHHEKKLRGKAGVNFGVVFSFWDWLFRTAYMPLKQTVPDELGFSGQENMSNHFLMRFFLPFLDTKKKKHPD